MTIAVDWDVKQQNKQTNQQTIKVAIHENKLSAYALCKQFGTHLQQLLSAHISALINAFEVYIANNMYPDQTALLGAV